MAGVYVFRKRQRRHGFAWGSSFVAWIKRLPAGSVLVCLYVLFSLIRILSAFVTTTTPVIMPDSALYMQLSRSIFEDGRLLFRGQPIRYEYILYPLLLSPLHLLPEGVSFFRAAQVVNVLMMHLSIFPVFALARAITKSKQHALLAVLLTLLMPDFQMTKHIMAESVAFPLVLTACYTLYPAVLAKRLRLSSAVLSGGIGVLLYALKPGYIAMPICFFLLMLRKGLKVHDKFKLYWAIVGIFTMLAFLGLYILLLRYGFQMSLTQSTLYGSQTHPFTGDHILQTVKGLALYVAYLMPAFCFFPLLLPAAHAKALLENERQLLNTILFAIGVIILGIVYVIYGDERVQSGVVDTVRVHMRYVSAFLPVLLVLLFSPALYGKKLNAKCAVAIALSILLFLCFSWYKLESGSAYPADALLLTALASNQPAFDVRIVWTVSVFACLICVFISIARHGFMRGQRRAACIFIAAAFLLNGSLSFFQYRYHMNSLYPRDAMQAVLIAGHASSLGVVRDGGCFWPEAGELDVASRCALPIVEMDDLIANAQADGSLGTFVPKTYWQEHALNPVYAPERLILTNELLSSLVLAKNVRSDTVATANGGYCVVSVRPGQPVLHSALSGLREGWVQGGSRFTLFDKTLRLKSSITLKLKARAGEGQATLMMRCGEQKQAFAISNSLQWVEASFEVNDPDQALTVKLSSDGGNIFVYTYLVE